MFCLQIRYILSFQLCLIHTYIIDHYNSSVRITIWLHTALMLCALILYVSGGTYSLKSTLKDRIFEKLFMAITIYSQSFCQKFTERKSKIKYFFIFRFVVARRLNLGLSSNKPKRHQLHVSGNFKVRLSSIKKKKKKKTMYAYFVYFFYYFSWFEIILKLILNA